MSSEGSLNHNEIAADEEFEEITSDEVDRVIELLEEVAANVQSQNILSIQTEASDSIYELVYDEEDALEDALEDTEDAADLSEDIEDIEDILHEDGDEESVLEDDESISDAA